MKKVFLYMFLIVSTCFSKEYKVGFAQDTFANDWRLAQVNEVKNEIKKYPFLKLTVKNANAQISKQIADIEYFIDNKFDFIITSPINSKITSMALKKAINQGIKVILIDRGIDSNDYTSFIAPDNYKIAKQAALYMVKGLDEKGTILMIKGIKGTSVTNERREGFLEITNKYPNIKILEKRANFLRADAINTMENIYKEKVLFNAIYSHSDSMLSGVRSVLDKYKKDKSFMMVGIDYIKETQDAIKNKNQTVSFTYPTCGKEGIETIVKIIRNEEIEKNKVIDSVMVTSKNVESIKPIF